jgi:uncharacterized Zn finger protein (UPF0148 family)
MSSLKEKDKTYSYFQCPKCGSRKIQWIGNIIICLNCDYRDEAKNFEIELVRLEDAEKELDELKQKIREFLNDLKGYCRQFCGEYKIFGYCRMDLEEKIEKFEERMEVKSK